MPRSMPEVGDDMWGPAVSERERERENIVFFLYFLILNSAESLEICRKIIIAPKILKNRKFILNYTVADRMTPHVIPNLQL